MSIEKSSQPKYGITSKVFIPVSTGLISLFLIYQIYASVTTPNSEDNSAVLSWSLWSSILPVFLMLLLLVQWLIVAVLWYKIILESQNILFSGTVAVISLSLTIGVFSGFVIWSRQFGFKDLVISVLTMASIQLLYWAVNFYTLFITQRNLNKQLIGAK